MQAQMIKESNNKQIKAQEMCKTNRKIKWAKTDFQQIE